MLNPLSYLRRKWKEKAEYIEDFHAVMTPEEKKLHKEWCDFDRKLASSNAIGPGCILPPCPVDKEDIDRRVQQLRIARLG